MNPALRARYSRRSMLPSLLLTGFLSLPMMGQMERSVLEPVSEDSRALVSSAYQSGSQVVIDGGRFYKDGGEWKESQERIEPAPGGASVQSGPMKLRLGANASRSGLVDLTTPTGARFLSHPLGLFLFSRVSGRSIQIATLRESAGEILPPNQVIWRDCFDGVKADLRVTYTRQAFESDIILREDVTSLPQVAVELLKDPTLRLETWTEFLSPPQPRVVERVLHEETDPVKRAAMVEPDLVDQILDFGDLLFVEGRAFETRDEGALRA